MVNGKSPDAVSVFAQELESYKTGGHNHFPCPKDAPFEVSLWYDDDTTLQPEVVIPVDPAQLEGLVWGEHALAHLAGQGISGNTVFAGPSKFNHVPLERGGLVEGAYVWQLASASRATRPAPSVWNAVTPRVPLKVVLAYRHRHHVTLTPLEHHIDGVIWGETLLTGLAQRGISVTFVDELAYATANSPADTCLLVNDGVVCG